MSQIDLSAKITQLYSIKTDDAQDFKLDKIDFLTKMTKQFYDSFKEDQNLQITGLFGTHQEVEREIKLQINQEVTLQSYLIDSDKGNLIAIKFQNFMIFCFILSETFFVNKPINEKAIEIVLFRILQDLTDNIKFCLNDEIFKNHWYQGDIIPFNQIQQRAVYHFAESQIKQIQIYDCKWVLSQKNTSDYQIINSQTLSPQLIRIRQIHFNDQEEKSFNQNYANCIIYLLFYILKMKQKQTTQAIMKTIKLEHQSLNLKNMLDELSNKLEEAVDVSIKKLIAKLLSLCSKQKIKDTQKELFEQYVNIVLQTLELQNLQKFHYNVTWIEPEAQKIFFEQIDIFFQKIMEKVNKIQGEYDTRKQQLIDELRKQTNYEVERINLKLSRANGQESGRVQSISHTIDNQSFTILNGNFLQLGINKFKVVDVFETKEKGHIFIITSSNEKGQPSKTHIYFQSYKSLQIQQLKQLDIKDTEKAVYFHDYNKGHLFIFNFKTLQVQSIILTPRGSISKEQQVYYQQERDCSFFVSHVAYLKMVNKFIVLSQDKQVYKQQDQGQDFEKVKCRISNINGGLEQKNFQPSIRPENKYLQLLACPSGKYFYLANQYCCDRYDINCLKIDTIEIEGPIKIFADSSDVIILGQLHSRDQKKAKIFCNLVSQKKFNKQQNDEKKVIGNPALDIAKGSFIKFGPNSQFLLKEKNSTITLNFDNQYQNIVKSYLNIMKVNEIILSSSQLQSAEFKSEQIKNIIFSRVPLQLCTIENSNLIPLNDGFRQETQTQTLTSVEQKVKQLHLGFLEKHLFNYNKKIFVVGIIGKQSSGKSYLLNRVFGTRFAVSSARCTDGVWASIAYVEDQTFLVLDCEGLFNGARSDKEEIKMLAFLTALCDITILNSDLTFNRHFNDLFNHLVEASKQLNDEKLFKGILYFILRDVSSQDNAGAEQELLKNLERLKEGGSEDIIFLKRLFNNKIAVESLVNYELKLFDDQIVSVRKYFLEQSAILNHWKCGRELIQIMKILLCQLELSDNTNASLIDLQILIEKIFEECQELWYDFSSNEVQDINLKLVQSDYKFPKFEPKNTSYLIKIYSNYYTIPTHNKNLLQVRTQFNLMMEQRKEQIIQRAQQETNSIDNKEVREKIEKNMSLLKIFLKDQINQFQFCEAKCDECHLQCKQFKNHIEISQTLMSNLDDEIKNFEDQQRKSNLKDKSQVETQINRIHKINDEIKQAEYFLEGLITQNKIIEMKEKISKEKEAMKNYDFYDQVGNSINTSVFQTIFFQNPKLETATLEEIQNLFENEIKFLQKKKGQSIESINQSKAQLENLIQSLNQYQQDIKQIEIRKEELESFRKEISIQKLNTENKLQNVQSEIQTIWIAGNEMNIQDLQIKIEDENKSLIEIQDQLQNQQLIYKQYAQELEGLKIMNEEEQIQYLQQLEQDINDYIQKQNQLEEEIESLKKSKRDLEDIRLKLEKEQSKKIGKNNNTIEELIQKLKGFDELQIIEKLSQCEIKQKELEKSFRNFENSDLYNQYLEQISLEQQQQENVERERKMKLMNWFIIQKEEKITKITVIINSLQEQTKSLRNNIDHINQKIKEIIKINISQSYISKICEFEKRLEDQDQIFLQENEKFIHLNQAQESTKNKLDQLIKNTNELENQNDEIDSQINHLNFRLKQIKLFSENQNEYTVLNTTLQEEEIKLKLLTEFESINNVQQLELQRKIEQLQIQIDNLKEEQGSLSNQLTTYNQIAQLEQKWKNLQDLKQQLFEQKFEVHSCQRRSHKCDQNCKLCPDKKCDHKAGHDEKQEHLCNKQDHRCQDSCQIINCKRKCMKSFKHDQQHICENDHPCEEKCQYCNKKCKKVRTDSHDTNHDCLDNYCPHNCKLCSRKCCEPHKHSLQKDNHFCENVHYCQEPCQEDGICKLEYEVVQAIWKTNESEFPYTRYIPKNNGKQICEKQIPARCDKHYGKHLCKEKTEKQFHLCNQQCPECNTYCDLKYGHPGLHSSDRHRNKENQIFTTHQQNQSKITIYDQKETTIRKYKIGDSSAPETCDQSCKRRGRAHFHLVICEGGNRCLKMRCDMKARHSDERYVGFEQQNFDEVLCEDFWKKQNWIHPILNELENITKCNFYCPLCKLQNINNHQFCDKEAWHTNDKRISSHSFSCVESHLQNQIKGINITFVIDSTESMGEYIQMCKVTIEEIMKKSQTYKQANGQPLLIKFAAVSYKDHQFPYKASQKLIDTQDFSTDNVIITFLKKILLESGFDYPEAVLDGLDAALKLSWNPNFEKLLYLIADSPPHGQQYHNFQDNYPNGCPCGLKQQSILRMLQNLKVKLKILKLNQDIDMMIGHFKKDFADIQVLTPNDKNLVAFQNLIVNDVCSFLVQNEITYQMKK